MSSLRWWQVLITGLLMGCAAQALAFVHFDFDQKYFIHPHRQVWDFSIIRPDSVYHIYYHTIHEDTPHASYADTIWHSTSMDLKHWTIEGPILTVGQGPWDEGALWAPDVFWDHVKERWALAYTACDSRMNQRIAMAFSDDLYSWTKSDLNPVVEPDPEIYVWNPDGWWSDFRDPFVWSQDGVYHLLVTAKQILTEATGVLYHGVSLDLEHWIDIGYIFSNDGIDPWRVLESPQYKVLNNQYYLLFGEYDTGGISCVPSDLPANWTMDNRQWIDYGYAPELDEFDEGIHIFSRIAPFDTPATGIRSYVVRLDTMTIHSDGILDPYQPHPLAESWASWTGSANLAQPTWGDNSAMRGDAPVGLVGNGYYGSKEYYQGPLSGRGSPGTMLGDAATGVLKSPEFRITGTRMTLLVGGGHYPETCYVALIDAEADTIIYSETGNDQELMTLRQWDLTPYHDRLVNIQIVDQENDEYGHINVDEIREDNLAFSPVDDAPPLLAEVTHRAWPNPFNPQTRIHFDLPRDMVMEVRIHDLRGRLVWNSGARQWPPGPGSVAWQGQGLDGSSLPAGTYLYRLESGSRSLGTGKLSLVK